MLPEFANLDIPHPADTLPDSLFPGYRLGDGVFVVIFDPKDRYEHVHPQAR